MGDLVVDLDGIKRLAGQAREVEARCGDARQVSAGSVGHADVDQAISALVDRWGRADVRSGADAGELAVRLEIAAYCYERADATLAASAPNAAGGVSKAKGIAR